MIHDSVIGTFHGDSTAAGARIILSPRKLCLASRATTVSRRPQMTEGRQKYRDCSEQLHDDEVHYFRHNGPTFSLATAALRYM